MLQVGIVGLPNVGKSTLFNALTKSHKADAQNYPFCTIDPNVGVVEVPDDRLLKLAELSKSRKIVPAAIEVVDIAGLVAGASKGEGLGNKFLANIREVDAVIHLVRCFENSDIVHTGGNVNPIRDIGIINTELLLADLQSIDLQIEKNIKRAKGGNSEAKENVELLKALKAHLDQGNFAISFTEDVELRARIRSFNLLTFKSTIFACNVDEKSMSAGIFNEFVTDVLRYVSEQQQSSSCVICSQIEAEVADLQSKEAAEFLKELGIIDSGVSQLIKSAYRLLGLGSFFTTGEDETRAWTFRLGMKAPQCAGVIHGDFESGFIKAEVADYGDILRFKGWVGARDAGKVRLEGKDYKFKDGDVTIFRFGK